MSKKKKKKEIELRNDAIRDKTNPRKSRRYIRILIWLENIFKGGSKHCYMIFYLFIEGIVLNREISKGEFLR